MALALAFFGATGLAVEARAANSVKTERIFVPEEKPADENAVSPKEKVETDDDESVQNPAVIPDSALPDLSDTSEDANSNVDDNPPAEQTRNSSTPPEIQRDLSALPAPVKRMHELMIEAARAGEIEKLRALIGIGETATSLSVGELEGDPIEFLKDASGDDEGFEILAILLEVLESGFVHVDEGTPEELYVWPYFFEWPLDKLDAKQKVELYQLLTAGDVQDSENFGSYIFYRVGITPQGEWAFFVAGD